MKPYFESNGIAIYHGDCREILPAIEAEGALVAKQAIMVTDPPYGLGKLLHRPQGPGTKGCTWSADLWGSGAPEWDTVAAHFVVEFAARFLHSIIWGGNYYALPPARGWLVWDKVVREFSTGVCELAWTTLDQPVKAFNFCIGSQGGEFKAHPTQKPLPLIRWCLEQKAIVEATDAVIVDPFMGSGTTLRAAKDLHRRAIGIDISERYCEHAALRLGQGVLPFALLPSVKGPAPAEVESAKVAVPLQRGLFAPTAEEGVA